MSFIPLKVKYFFISLKNVSIRVGSAETNVTCARRIGIGLSEWRSGTIDVRN
jgi:hypothetical protein